MNYGDAIEKLSVYFSAPSYENEVLKAKSEFFGDVGVDDKESERYEQWMNIFFDWYLFTRPISGTTLPPSQYALEIDEFQQLHGDEKRVFSNLARSEHSLLQFIKVRGDFAFFKDIFRRRKVKVVNNEFVITLEKGDICDARVIPDEDHFFFTKGFCVHPIEANRFILKESKALKKADEKDQQAFQIELLRMFFKLQQYSHLKCDAIYSRDSKVRF